MKSLVVYESMFGNTANIARAIASGLESHSDVEVHDVQGVSPEAARTADLIVAGGPTHAFSMSRPSTRADAVKQGAPQRDAATGLREWLAELGSTPHTALVATFDTRVDKVRHLPGSAARSAFKTVHRLGYHTAAKPHSFYVKDTPGPLLPGETDRARAWGETLGAELKGHHSRV
jgi:flavodoxin